MIAFFAAWLGVILLYGWILKRRRWLAVPGMLFFGLGWYLHNAFQASVIVAFSGKDPARALVTAVVDGLIIFLLWRQIRRHTGLKHTS